MKNCTSDTIVIVPNGVQAGNAERYVHIEPSGDVVRPRHGRTMDFPGPGAGR